MLGGKSMAVYNVKSPSEAKKNTPVQHFIESGYDGTNSTILEEQQSSAWVTCVKFLSIPMG